MQGMIIFHPHAATEGLNLSERFNLNWVGIFPQTATINSNRWIYSTEKLFDSLNLDSSKYDEIGDIIRSEKEKYLSRYTQENKKFLSERTEDEKKLDMDITSLLIYFSGPDKGSYRNADLASNRYGLHAVKSAKKRKGEGKSNIESSENLEQHLLKLKKYATEATIKVYVLDDFQNTGTTGNDEAEERIKQIKAFNKKYGTKYQVDVELIVSHLVYPYPELTVHDNLSRITSFDTSHFIGGLFKRLDGREIATKLRILQTLPYHLAEAMAFDYFAQKLHINEGRNVRGAVRRFVTDKDLVMNQGLGADLGEKYHPHEEL